LSIFLNRASRPSTGRLPRPRDAGSIGAYYPEANNLCPLNYQDPESGTPSYKSLPVRLHKVA